MQKSIGNRHPNARSKVPARTKPGNEPFPGCYRAAAALQPQDRMIRHADCRTPTNNPTPPRAPKEKAMSHTVPTQHPAVVLRSNYQHLRALLAIAIVAIVGLTVAVVVLATSGNSTLVGSAAHANSAAISARNASAELGAKLNHRGVTTSSVQEAPNTANSAAPAGPNPD
jgi:hypothetical protein